MLGLLVGQTGGRLVQEHDSRIPDDDTRELDEAPGSCAQAPDFLPGRLLEPDEGKCVVYVALPCGAPSSGVLLDHRDVLEHRQALDRLFLLERAPQAPAGAAVVGHAAAGPRRNARTAPVAGDTKPLSTLKNVVLPAPFGPIRPQVPCGNDDGHVVERYDASEADCQPLDLDHGPRPIAPASRLTPPEISRPRFRMSLGNLVDKALGSRDEHLEDADPEEDEEKVGIRPEEVEPVVQERGQQVLKQCRPRRRPRG